jgi:hypothetical protein
MISKSQEETEVSLHLEMRDRRDDTLVFEPPVKEIHSPM